MAVAGPVTDELWDGFHRLVNMSSRELRDWLRTTTAEQDHEQFLDQAEGVATGQHVLNILGKRRADLTDADAEVMLRVVAEIERQRGFEPETKPGDAAWRRRLMSLGHDPLKPV
jgi:Protein of unknown function (DUF3140)